jgi:hypothetical protein
VGTLHPVNEIGRIAHEHVTAFIVREIGAPEPDAYVRFPDRPLNRQQLTIAFERFGLPDRAQ